MSAWFQLWKRSLDIASGAPEVIAQRSAAMQRSPWALETVLESNRMVVEKISAANGAMWSLWRDSLLLRWPGMPWPPAGQWLPPVDGGSQAHALRSAHRALAPYARAIRANRARLRRKAARHG